MRVNKPRKQRRSLPKINRFNKSKNKENTNTYLKESPTNQLFWVMSNLLRTGKNKKAMKILLTRISNKYSSRIPQREISSTWIVVNSKKSTMKTNL